MGSVVCSDVYGKMEWDTNPSKSRCSPCFCCVKVGTRAGHSSCLSAAGMGGGRHQGCGASLKWDLS